MSHYTTPAHFYIITGGHGVVEDISIYFHIIFNLLQYLGPTTVMANIAHLVRASGCGSEGNGFNPRYSPQNE